MAIIKNGKIHGRIGNYVYRVVNGQEIIQSRPRIRKQSREAKADNTRFGQVSQMNAKIYRPIKDFALNALHGSFYRELFAWLKSTFFHENGSQTGEGHRDWQLFPDTRDWAINKSIRPEELAGQGIGVSVKEGIVNVSIPQLDFRFTNKRLLKNATQVEVSCMLIHYDFEEGHTTTVYTHNSQRWPLFRKTDAEELNITLHDGEEPIKEGLLVLCFGLRFFAFEKSMAYLNNREFNPCSVVGMWRSHH